MLESIKTQSLKFNFFSNTYEHMNINYSTLEHNLHMWTQLKIQITNLVDRKSLFNFEY